MINRLLVSCIILLASLPARAQTAPSPFTSIGVGKVTNHGMIQHQSYGLGIGTGSYWAINNINPALLVYNRNTIFGELTSFQTGVLTETKAIKNETISENSTGSNMSYLALAFPVVNNYWHTTIGLMPYSTVNYNLNYNYDIAGSNTPARIQEKGSGGYNQLYWSNGVTLHKNISVGLRSSFLFSPLITEFTTSVSSEAVPSQFMSTVYQRTNPSGFIFSGGVAYQDSIRREGKRPLKITFGAIYDFQRDIRAKEFETIQRRTSLGVPWESDTINNNTSGNITMPSGLGFGVSLSEQFKWTVGIDVKIDNWTEYRRFGEPTSNANNSLSIALGGELTPDAFATDEYLSRVTYRAGLNYEKAPYYVNGMVVNDFGINFGLSLPIVASKTSGLSLNKGFSSVDLAFRYGRQGNVETNLLEEEYFSIHFGITFNDKWFVKRKFN